MLVFPNGRVTLGFCSFFLDSDCDRLCCSVYLCSKLSNMADTETVTVTHLPLGFSYDPKWQGLFDQNCDFIWWPSELLKAYKEAMRKETARHEEKAILMKPKPKSKPRPSMKPSLSVKPKFQVKPDRRLSDRLTSIYGFKVNFIGHCRFDGFSLV